MAAGHARSKVKSTPATTTVLTNSSLTGRSPFSVNDKNEIVFDYNIFVTTWQDQIKMRHYQQCEQYCRNNIQQLRAAEKNPYVTRKGSRSVSSKDYKSNNNNKKGHVGATSSVQSNNSIVSGSSNSIASPSGSVSPSHLVSNSASGLGNKSNSSNSSSSSGGGGGNNSVNINNVTNEDLSSMYREYRSKVHFSLAYLLKKYMKNYKEAKIEYELSIETDPENPGSHFNLANMLAESMYKDYNGAKYHFEKAIELEPLYATYRMFYAEFLWHDMNNHEESEKQYEELLKFTNDNEDIYFNYGLLLRDHLNKFELAVEIFEKALELAPNDNEAEEELEYTKKLLKESKQKGDEKEEANITDGSDNEMPIPNDAKVSHQKTGSELAPSGVKPYQSKHKKKISSFRKSQHDIVLPEILASQKLENKYYEVLNQKNNLKQQLVAKTNEIERLHSKLEQIESLLKQTTMENCLSQGADYIAANANQVHEILKQIQTTVNTDTIDTQIDTNSN